MATSKITPAPLTRSLGAIAEEIGELWPQVRNEGTFDPLFSLRVGQHPANPYWKAMGGLRDLDGRYYGDPVTEVVRRFLSNASGFRGEGARRIKAELEAALADHQQRKSRANHPAGRRRTTSELQAARRGPAVTGLQSLLP